MCLRKAIQTSIGCVKEAGRAVNHMFLILLVPILQTVGLFLFFLVFVYYAVHLVSLGEITSVDIPVDERGDTEIAVRVFEMNDFVERCAWCTLTHACYSTNYQYIVRKLMDPSSLFMQSICSVYFGRQTLSWLRVI